MREKNLFLENKKARKLYHAVKDLPVIDYHCHLSPKEIYEDEPFSDIGEMWLSGDHYKWRLMRAFGIEEEYITGTKPYKEKFFAFAKAMSQAAGSPLYHWCKLELLKYFHITLALNEQNAEAIYKQANAVIKQERLSPRKLIELSQVSYIATTDDVIDSLAYHKKIREDKSIAVKVCPSFRTDNLLTIRRDGYLSYIEKLSRAAHIEIRTFSDFLSAIENRLDYFVENGCKFTDVGIPLFPSCTSTAEEAAAVFERVLSGEVISMQEENQFVYYMDVYLAAEYKKRNLVMQLHLAVSRNNNTKLFEQAGADCGGDCVGDCIPLADMISLFDKINANSGFPQTIVYTLNSAMYDTLASAIGCYKNIRLGSAWWFQDHKDGIEKQIKTYAQTLNLSGFLGMLTDSRSFLSYARHDYFRRILCSIIGEWIEKKEFADDENAMKLVRKICYENINRVIGE